MGRQITEGTYLGIPSLIGRSKRKAFDYLKDYVWKRLHNWNAKKLSRAGKEIFLKTVAQALSIYVMSILLLPTGLCHDIERMFNSFWWSGKLTGGHGINWVKWDSLCS